MGLYNPGVIVQACYPSTQGIKVGVTGGAWGAVLNNYYLCCVKDTRVTEYKGIPGRTTLLSSRMSGTPKMALNSHGTARTRPLTGWPGRKPPWHGGLENGSRKDI